ncbi:MAG: hypothetical protein J6K21_02300 [Bacilli bacterium]|nr:hypothetical protein [Bacilli bacterium]
MYKKNILNILLILTTIILIISFDALNVFDTLVYLMPLLFSISITMFMKRKEVNKCKSIYNVIMMLLIVFSFLFLGILSYSNITCLIDENCSSNYEIEGLILLITILYTLLFTNIVDIKLKHNKMYNILLYIISFVVFIIYGRYYLDNDFYHNYINLSKEDINIQSSYIYITQNYIYFNIVYLCLLMYYFVNRKKNK